MPIIYHVQHERPHSPSSSSSSHENDLQPTDADASIVLSDLVRTGEASRLRRRGAMRLDHNIPPIAPIVPNPPVDEMLDYSDDEGLNPPNPWFSRDRRQVRYPSRSRQRDRDRRAGFGVNSGTTASTDTLHDDESNEYRYTLVCGGIDSSAETDNADAWDDQNSHSWTPSILPVYPPSTSSSTQTTKIRGRTRQTNGCGTLVHLRAAPRQRLNMWTAKSSATSAVVAMDPVYFDRSAVAKIVRSACGCVREGVGCAVCGNPLGTRYIPCKTATDGLFSSRPKPSPPLRPEGPRYWHASPPTSSSTNCVYSFFSTAVSSYPQYNFPPKPPPISSRVRAYSSSSLYPPSPILIPPSPLPFRPPTNPTQGQGQPETDASSPPVYNPVTMFDNYITASPTPLSDVGEGEEETRPEFSLRSASSFYQQQMQIRIESQEWEMRQQDMYRDRDQEQGTNQDQGWGWGMTTRARTRARVFDPDGADYDHENENDNEEPGSPDKIGEGILLPER